MKDQIAGNWCELQSLLFQDSWDMEHGKHISPYVFRGLSSSSYCLKSKLARLNCGQRLDKRKDREDALYRNLKKYAHEFGGFGYGLWHWWSVAQHYGLATRLMDWTYSPLVAAHFATEIQYPTGKGEKEDDGVIWAVNFREAHALIPKSLIDTLGQAKLFTIDLLPALESFRDFDELPASKFVLFFEPPSFDQRIVNQFAVFSVMQEETNPAAELVTLDEPMENWLQNSGITARKIVIPRETKAEIRQKLDQCNISERVLLPGLEGICKWLNRHYAPSASNWTCA